MKFENLLIISNTFPDEKNIFIGGIFVKEQLSYIRKYFKKVTVISPVPRSLGFKEDDKFCHNHSYENVKVYFPRFSHLPITYFRNRLGDNYFKTINKLIKRENIEFDLIHTHFAWPSGYVGAKIKEKYKVPLVVTAHGFDIYDAPFRNTILKKKVEYTLNSANCIITVGNSNLGYINKLNIKTPVEIIPNGFNKKLFHPMDSRKCRELLELPLNKKIILTIGNLVEIKGHKYLILAIKEILKQRKDVMCIIIGSGGLKGGLNELIKRLGLEAHVRLVCAKPHEEIPLWMNACDVFVLSSLSEGNPTVMFECLGCGKPFIGTNVGGIPEIIISEDYGFLVKPGNSGELAENLNKALEKEGDSEKIIQYSKQFTWKEISKKIVDVYREVLL